MFVRRTGGKQLRGKGARGGEYFGLMFAGYVPLASQNPYPIIV